MKANELRIGNFVWDDYSGEMIVFGIVTGGINPRVELRKSERLPAGSYTIDKLKPIPLTEEWLLKFDNPSWLRHDAGGYFYWFDGEKKYIKFLHTLQNVYFAIETKDIIWFDTKKAST